MARSERVADSQQCAGMSHSDLLDCGAAIHLLYLDVAAELSGRTCARTGVCTNCAHTGAGMSTLLCWHDVVLIYLFLHRERASTQAHNTRRANAMH